MERCTYIYKITPVKENFLQVITEEDQSIIGEHFAYLKELLDRDMLLLAGPCADAAFGIAIFYAGSQAEAEQVLINDPAVIKGVFKGEVREYRISLINQNPEQWIQKQ